MTNDELRKIAEELLKRDDPIKNVAGAILLSALLHQTPPPQDGTGAW